MKTPKFQIVLFFSVLLLITLPAASESCSTSSEMTPEVKSALQATAVRDFGYVAQGNTQALLQASIQQIASNAPALEQLLSANKADLAGATSQPRNTFLLEAPGNATLEHAEFFCGVMNSPIKIGFSLTNLPPGKYGLVIMDVTGSKTPYFYSMLLLQQGTDWKIAGLFPKARQLAGHDAQWYWQQARDFKAKGEAHNAWFYYLVAQDLAAPVPFMATDKLDNFNQEVQASMPPDLPQQKPQPLSGANGKTYTVTELFVLPNDKGQGLDLVMKYQAVSDVADTAKTFIENKEAMKALLTKYPELREPFGNLVARAVAPTGQDFGSMLPIKDVK